MLLFPGLIACPIATSWDEVHDTSLAHRIASCYLRYLIDYLLLFILHIPVMALPGELAPNIDRLEFRRYPKGGL
jgi:hypothetical protein